MTRAEHLEWAKRRAIEYCDAGDWLDGWISFVSDLQKHEQLAGHIAIELGSMQILGGLIKTAAQMKKFIEDFG
jgi:hypothetical protein